MPPPRLLFVTTVPSTFRRFLLPYVRHFNSLGWRISGAANGLPADPTVVEALETCHHVPWGRSPRDPQNARALLAIRRLLVNERFDIVHTHTPVASFLVRLAAASLPRSQRPIVIYTAHGFHFHPGGKPLPNLVFRSLERLAGRWTDYLVTINDEDFRAAKSDRIVPSGRLMRMRGIGVDLREFSASALAPAQQHEGPARFLMIAEFNPGKRHRDVVKALHLIKDRTDARVAFAGRGRGVEEVRSLVESLGLADRIDFLGFREDIPQLIAAARATILPSEREGLPRAVLESLAMGTPVIGTRIRGITDLLEDGGGILVPVGDVEALADAMLRLAQDAGLAEALGSEGRKSVEVYDIKRLIGAHEHLYERALQGQSVISHFGEGADATPHGLHN